MGSLDLLRQKRQVLRTRRPTGLDGATLTMSVEAQELALRYGRLGLNTTLVQSSPCIPTTRSFTFTGAASLRADVMSRARRSPPCLPRAEETMKGGRTSFRAHGQPEVHRGDQSAPLAFSGNTRDCRLTPSQLRKGRRRHLRSLPEPKRAFLGLLGWNSYGTEGAQGVANVRRCASAKTA